MGFVILFFFLKKYTLDYGKENQTVTTLNTA